MKHADKLLIFIDHKMRNIKITKHIRPHLNPMHGMWEQILLIQDRVRSFLFAANKQNNNSQYQQHEIIRIRKPLNR
ncbi:MAG: hypothetical protein U9N85_14085 [Bacteroidota bacterium]|nr:hypothetical protein [Bacteroidota bacterium]